MELVKFFLMVIISPAGEGDVTPVWTSESFITLEECKASADLAQQDFTAEYGKDARIETYCLSIDARLPQ